MRSWAYWKHEEEGITDRTDTVIAPFRKGRAARKYAGKHVPVVGDRVVPLKPQAKAVWRDIEQLEQKYGETPVVTFVPCPNLTYICRHGANPVPVPRIGKEYLGTIWRPYATVMIRGSNQRWISVEMVVDSGADHTLLPGRYAALLGIDLHACVKRATAGVGGPENIYLYKVLDRQFGKLAKKKSRSDSWAATTYRLCWGVWGSSESLDVRFRNRQSIFAKP